MPEVFKKLAERLPTANALETLYTVPANTSSVACSLIVCNQGASMARFRVSHAVAGAVDARAQYLYYDEIVPANKSFVATLGITLAAGDELRVHTDGEMSFNAYGSELS